MDNADEDISSIDGDDGEPPPKQRRSSIFEYFGKKKASTAKSKDSVPNVVPRKEINAKKSLQQSCCLTCALKISEERTGKTLSTERCLLSRSDKTTKNRHVKRNHPEVDLSATGLYDFIVPSTDVRAKKLLEKIKSTRSDGLDEEENISEHVDGNKDSEPCTSQSHESPQSPVHMDETNDLSLLDSDIDFVENPSSRIPAEKQQLGIGGYFRSMQAKEPDRSNDSLPALNRKIDELSATVSSLVKTVKGTEKATNPLGPILSLGKKPIEETLSMVESWKDATDISELCTLCPKLRFFAGNEKQNSVLRCETCFVYLTRAKHYDHKTMSVTEALSTAKKGIGSYYNCIASGLIISPEKAALLLNGHNKYFANIKKTVKDHMLCNENLSRLHFDALKFVSQLENTARRKDDVTENLIRVAINTLQMKAASIHFEQNISCHVATGSDMGDMSHGRKQFIEILQAAEIYVDAKIGEFLSEPLKCTGLPPHYYATADKSTIHRITNQGVLLCPFVEGKREAIAVKAPVIYAEDPSSEVPSVSGANAMELAESMYYNVTGTYHSLSTEFFQAAWQGTVCDGQYQAKGFHEKLKELLNQDTTLFNAIIWDLPHLIHLAFEDVFKGKIGHSKEFMSLLISRSSKIHQIFQRGKMLAQAKQQSSNDDGEKLLLTSRACATRFATSQIHEFNKLIQSLPTYIKTFRNHAYSQVKECEIAGQDFVIDLLGCCDVTLPMVKLLVEVQGLQVPIWKICVWWPKVKKDMETLEISLVEPPKLCPNLKTHASDVCEKEIFKGVKLVEGWILVDSTNEKDGNNVQTIQNWRCREQDDCLYDLKKLKEDLVESMNERFQSSVTELQHILVSVDIDKIVEHLCGKRGKHGIISIDENALEQFGSEDFRRFFAYVCSQKHVEQLTENEELMLQPGLSHVVHRRLKVALKDYIWNPKYQKDIAEWFHVLNVASGTVVSGLPDGLGTLQSFGLCDQKFTNNYHLSNVYQMTYHSKSFLVAVNESAVYKSLYCNQNMYEQVGKEAMIAIDIALAKGGTEAVVESFYSKLSSHSMAGGQSNETLALRSKLDWCLPPVLQMQSSIKEIAKIYINGCKERNFKSHQWPIIGDRKSSSYTHSKVLDRIKATQVKFPFLL